jgi:hypothetical protein
LKTLHARLWLAGCGFYVVGAIGQLLDRSIIDASVYGAERLVFEGAPVVVAPLAQDQEARRAKVFDGEIIDTLQAIPALTEQETQRLAELRVAAAHAKKSDAARKAWAEAFAERHGLSAREAERIAIRATQHLLDVQFELDFDDAGICKVGDVIDDPDRFVGATLADPLEGRAYGRGKAKVFRRRDRCLMIHSFAHGGIDYTLADQGVRLDDFRSYKPARTYIFTPVREPWPAASVNSTIPPVPLLGADGHPLLDSKGNPQTISASVWLDQHQAVEQLAWSPGDPMLIEDQLLTEGGWIKRNGVTTLNLYRPPHGKLLSPNKAEPWLEHVHKIYPDDAEHLIRWMAQRVQRPAEKINHALVLGGPQGIGKDTMLEPLKHAVGRWNFPGDLAPPHMGRQVQQLRAGHSAAHQRGARSRRKRPLQVLRAYENLHCGAARRAARQRETPARIQPGQLRGRHHHHQLPDRQPVSAQR